MQEEQIPNKNNKTINETNFHINNTTDYIGSVQIKQKRLNSKQILTLKPKKLPRNLLKTIALKSKKQRTKPGEQTQTQINDRIVEKIQTQNNSKLTSNILSSIRSIRKKFVCEICVCEYSDKNRKKIGKCQHSFCDGCLRQYAEYKIARFEEVVCPSELCPEVLDIAWEFYATLSPSLREKYLKVHTFHQAAQNNQRLCPDEKCKDGVLTVQEGSNPRCNKCSKVFCRECFFPEHEGSCGQNEVDFFQNNFKFRQCAKCKAVVEKKEGCNHITCRCKYEFCYLCGKKWLSYEEHRCDRVQQRCCQCRCCQCHNCSHSILKLLVNIMIFPIFLLVLVINLLVLVIIQAFLLSISLILGICYYSCDFICSLRSYLFIICLIFYPITMLIGIGISLVKFFYFISLVALFMMYLEIQWFAKKLFW